jgi:hypothetical protein
MFRYDPIHHPLPSPCLTFFVHSETNDPAQVVERFFNEVWNGGEFAVLDEIVDRQCITHQVRSAAGDIAAAARGPTALRQHIEGWLAAFPDI